MPLPPPKKKYEQASKQNKPRNQLIFFVPAKSDRKMLVSRKLMGSGHLLLYVESKTVEHRSQWKTNHLAFSLKEYLSPLITLEEIKLKVTD